MRVGVTRTDSEQSPGVYLRDDPVLGTQLQNHCELRVPSAERAAYYLDCALAARSDDTAQESHLFFTLHVYQYSVAGKGGGEYALATLAPLARLHSPAAEALLNSSASRRPAHRALYPRQDIPSLKTEISGLSRVHA